MDIKEFLKRNWIRLTVVFTLIIVIFIAMILIFGSKVSVKKNDSYEIIESKMVRAAEKYANKNKSILPEMNKSKKIKLSTLKENKYINEIKRKNSSDSCDGYITISKINADDYTYEPYLDCGKEYHTTYLADRLINKGLVSDGDGLYQMDNKFVYKGDEPANYLTIDSRTYRILSINEDKEIRVLDIEQTELFTSWDNRYNTEAKSNFGINDFNKSRLKSFLETEYTKKAYSNTLKSLIEPKELCIGKRNSANNGDLTGEVECSEKTTEKYPLGIMQVNEYFNASLDPNCKTIDSKSCINYNYLADISQEYETLTTAKDNTFEVYSIYYGRAVIDHASKVFRPNVLFYLKNKVIYAGGKGTQENPYKVRIN